MTIAELGTTEISGKPGQVWGNLVVPVAGKTRFRIAGDMIHTTSSLSFGLERKQVFTRIQNVDSVELVEGRLWWLLWVGLFSLGFLIGIGFIIAFFLIKQRWMVVHSQNAALILFYGRDEGERASQFSQLILDMARKLSQPD